MQKLFLCERNPFHSLVGSRPLFPSKAASVLGRQVPRLREMTWLLREVEVTHPSEMSNVKRPGAQDGTKC